MGNQQLKTYRVDAGESPFVVIANVRGAKTADAQEFIGILEQHLDGGVPFVSIHDARWSPPWTAQDRQTTFEWLKREEPRLRRLFAAHLVLVRNSIARGMVNAIFWGSPLSGRLKTFAELAEAKVWGREAHARFIAEQRRSV